MNGAQLQESPVGVGLGKRAEYEVAFRTDDGGPKRRERVVLGRERRGKRREEVKEREVGNSAVFIVRKPAAGPCSLEYY